MRIAIIGAGPIGLEAALLATQLGHDVHVFEKGRVAENILDWGHVRLFSPFGMNASTWGKSALNSAHGQDFLPRDNELLRGGEFADRYLLPLSRLPQLAGRIHEQCQVILISRRHFSKTAGIGSPKRGAEPFQLLIEQCEVTRSSEPSAEVAEYLRQAREANPIEEPTPQENSKRVRATLLYEEHHIDERIELTDVVIDCSGTYPHHNWVGDGGQPCIGERDFLKAEHYRLPFIHETDYSNRILLVIGSGFSAATTVVSLAGLALLHPRTKVWWIANTQPGQSVSAGPISRVPNDPLPERDRIAAKANDLAVRGHFASVNRNDLELQPVFWLADATVTRIEPSAAHHDFSSFNINLDWSRCQNATCDRILPPAIGVDRIIANVGYRPDRSIYEELHVHECYATQGPIKLAAKLLGETSTDCLAQSSHGGDVLKNPEPNFFILGSKSYGRNSNFLLKVGIEQVRDVLNHLSGRGAVSGNSD